MHVKIDFSFGIVLIQRFSNTIGNNYEYKIAT